LRAFPRRFNRGDLRTELAMTAGVPWSVNAVERETWAAARDAARRAGLSVGEWLEQTIREGADEPHTRRTPREQPRADALEQRLDDISEQLDHLMRNGPQRGQPERAARTDPALAAAVTALDSRVEVLMRDIDTAERRVPAHVDVAIERLDSRIEELLAQSRSTAASVPPEVESKLDALSQAIEKMSARLEREPERPIPSTISPSIADLDDAIAEITVRQASLDQATLDDGTKGRMLDRRQGRIGRRAEDLKREPAPVAAHDFSGLERQLKTMADEMQHLRRSGGQAQAPALAPDLSGLERQLKTMADEMQHLRRSSVQAPAIEELRHQIMDLGRALAELAPRSSIEALERAIEVLTEHIDLAARTEPRENYSQVASALDEIRASLAEVRPAESFSAVEADLQELSRKLDVLNVKGLDGTTVARVQSELGEIRALLSSALPADVLKVLVDQIEVLAHKLESGPAADTKMLGAFAGLERRIDQLGERIETASHNAGAPAIAEIAGRLDELQRALANLSHGAPAGFEDLMHGVVDKLEAAETRLSRFDSIERSLNDLFAQFEETRTSAIDIAERAARSAIREAAATLVPRTQPSSSTEPVRRAPEPEPRPAAARESEPAIHREPQRPTAAPKEEPQAAARESFRSDPELMDPVQSAPPRVESKTATISGDLPPDYPLEPGSGGPHGRTAQSASERVAQSAAVLGPYAPKLGEANPRTAEFIAAARRAAQQAAAERATETPHSRAVGVMKDISTKLGGGGGKRSLLIGLLAILLVVAGTMRYADVLFPSFFSSVEILEPTVAAPPAARPAEPETPAEPTAPAAPAEPVPADRSALPTDPALASAPPAGVVGPAVTTVFLGQRGDPRDITGTVPSPAPKPGAVAFRPNDLPAGLGTVALRTAAMAGDPVAAYEIAARYFDGRGVEASGVEALRWFELARAAGSFPAAYRLGGIYEKGQRVTKNLSEARRYYLLAAEGGHIKAMHNLAVLHAEGVDGKPDFRTATRWFRMAADRGLRDSQYNLAVLYARGLGAEQNLAEAYRWFALAAIQGDPDAAKKRDDVANRLDPQTLIAAKLAVQTWAATPADVAANNVKLKPEWEKAETAPARRSVKN
jgi:localization factor PodJL